MLLSIEEAAFGKFIPVSPNFMWCSCISASFLDVRARRFRSTRKLRSDDRLANVGASNEVKPQEAVGGAVLRIGAAFDELSGGDLSVTPVGPMPARCLILRAFSR